MTAKKGGGASGKAKGGGARKSKGGRPSSYRPEFAALARKLCSLGAIDKDLAEAFGVSEQTVNAWKKAHPEFLEALKAAKEAADAKVERSLFERACGYTHEAVKILQHNGKPVIVPYKERYPPDATSMIFWLKNRRPDLWREKPEGADNETPPTPVSVVVQVQDARKRDADPEQAAG